MESGLGPWKIMENQRNGCRIMFPASVYIIIVYCQTRLSMGQLRCRQTDIIKVRVLGNFW